MSNEHKTGQHIDTLKYNLIRPVIVEKILDIPGLPKNFSFFDLGTGDVTSSRSVIIDLLHNGHGIQNLAVLDADINVFPDLFETIVSETMTYIDTQIVKVDDEDVINEFYKQYEGVYDVGLFQLVLHQIENDHAASYYMYLAHRALKHDGDLFLVNLHPKYLEYLSKNEPDKFQVRKREDHKMTGQYKFDSSGSAPVFSRNIETQLSMLLSLGYELSEVTPITTEAVEKEKKRYKDLRRNNIPMFYVMHLHKNEANYLSSTEGVVEKVEDLGDDTARVIFVDNDEIRIPKFSGLDKIRKGSKLVLHETYRREVKANILNYWIIENGQDISGGQLIVRRK